MPRLMATPISIDVVVAVTDRGPVPLPIALEEVCGACEGACEVYTPEWALWLSTYGTTDMKNLTPEAEAAMPDRDLEPCGECAGTGVGPTEAGRKLLEFINRPKGWV